MPTACTTISRRMRLIFCPLMMPDRVENPPLPTPSSKRKQGLEIVFLEAEGNALPVGLVVERGAPIDRAEPFLDLRRGESRRIESPDDGAHARPDDVINGDAQLFHDLEHADVGGAARTSAAEYQSDLGAVVGDERTCPRDDEQQGRKSTVHLGNEY